MRLQTEGAPDAADRHATQTAGLGQFAGAPVRLPAGRTLQCLDYDLLNLLVADLARRTWPGFVIQPLQTSLQKTGTPLPDHPFRATEFLSRGLIVQTFPTGQHHAGAPGEQRLTARAVRHRLQPLTFLCAQD